MDGRLSLRGGNFEHLLRLGICLAEDEERDQQPQYVQTALWDKGFHQRPSMVLPAGLNSSMNDASLWPRFFKEERPNETRQ